MSEEKIVDLDSNINLPSDGRGHTIDLSQLVFFITNITYTKVRDSFVGSLRGVAWL